MNSLNIETNYLAGLRQSILPQEEEQMQFTNYPKRVPLFKNNDSIDAPSYNQRIIPSEKIIKRWFKEISSCRDFHQFHATLLSTIHHRSLNEYEIYSKLLSRRLPVNHYSLNDATQCHKCGNADETIAHAMYDCNSSKQVWVSIRYLIQNLLKVNIPKITLQDIIFFFPDLAITLDVDQLRVLTLIHSVALYTIWNSREITACSFFTPTPEIRSKLALESFKMRLAARVECEYDADSEKDQTDDSGPRKGSLIPYSPCSTVSSGVSEPSDFCDSNIPMPVNVDQKFRPKFIDRY